MRRSIPPPRPSGAEEQVKRPRPAASARWQRWLMEARAAGKPLDDRIWLGAQPKRSAFERFARDLLARAGATLPARLALRALMREPEIRAELILFLSDFTAYAADFDAALRALQTQWAPQLDRALRHLGLRERVDLLTGDTRVHPPALQPYRLMLFDASVRGEALRAEIEHWWPALAPGGRAVFRDGRPKLPHLAEVGQAMASVERFPDAWRMPDHEVRARSCTS